MENQNSGINEEETQYPNNSQKQEFNNPEKKNAQTEAEELNEDQEYDPEFDERDQKRNIGQIGDTYPPDDTRPQEEDLNESDELNSANSPNTIRILEDESVPNDSDDNNKEAKEKLDLNRHEKISAEDQPSDSDQ